MRINLNRTDVLKALVTSAATAIVVRVARELAVSRDVTFNLSDAQWTEVRAMQPQAAEQFLDVIRFRLRCGYVLSMRSTSTSG